MKPKITIQDKIVKELYLRSEELTVKKLSDILRLKDWQITNALPHLVRRGLVVKTYNKNPASYCSAPYKKIHIKLTSMKYAKEVLNAKGLL
jgi:predicted transcriptional regulator